MRYVSLCLFACALIAVLGVGSKDDAPPPPALRSADFSADPNWESNRSRLVPDPPPITKQNFGYRPTRRAGGRSAGEIGGRVQRSATPASYAKVIKEKTFNDRLSASGRFSVTFDDNGNGILFGWFNSKSKGWRANNSLVFRLDGNGSKYWVFYEYGTQHWLTGGGGCFEGKQYQRTLTKPLLSDGTSHAWALLYDPDGNDGDGLVTFILDATPYRLPLAKGHKIDGATFDRFGILNQQTTGGTIEAYFDDLVLDGEAESFDRDPRWEARGNEVEFADRVRRPFHDFGFSATSFAGGKRGEIGGVIWRDDHPAWYADRVGPLSLDDELYASGRVAFTGAGSDSGVAFGWFDSSVKGEVVKDKKVNRRGFVGIHLEGPSRVGHYFVPEYWTSAGQGDIPKDGPIMRPDGKPHEWSLRYLPEAGKAGGKITVLLDGNLQVLDVPAERRREGAMLDRFGIFTYSADGNQVVMYLDDLKYSAKPAH